MLSNDIQTKLKEVIQSNLPAYVGEELQEFIKNANAAQAKIAKLEAAAVESSHKIKTLEAELREHTSMAYKLKAQAQQLEAIAAEQAGNRQLIQDLETYKGRHEAKVALAELQGVKDTMAMFLKVPVVRTSVQGSIPVAVDGMSASQYAPGYAGYVAAGAVATTTTTEES